MWKNNRINEGEKRGRQMMGDARWDRLIEALASQNQDITKYIVEWGYGEVYNRPHLSLPQRELVALTALAMVGHKDQLKTHIYCAVNAGITQDQVMEVFIQLSLFAGFPTALFAIQAAREVFDKLGPEGGGDAGEPPEKVQDAQG